MLQSPAQGCRVDKLLSSWSPVPLIYARDISFKIKYRPFHKTLPRSSLFVNWISVRFYEMDCSSNTWFFIKHTFYHIQIVNRVSNQIILVAKQSSDKQMENNVQKWLYLFLYQIIVCHFECSVVHT